MAPPKSRSVARAAYLLLIAQALHAQAARIEYRDQAPLEVTSADSSRPTRFALIGAGASFLPMGATSIIADTIFLYTPARFTITQATPWARIVALSDSPDLRVAVGAHGAPMRDLYVAGREFELIKARASRAPTP